MNQCLGEVRFIHRTIAFSRQDAGMRMMKSTSILD
jgi:hypothetical protein